VTWTDSHLVGPRVYFTLVMPGGPMRVPQAVGGDTTEGQPAVAGGLGNFFVAWSQALTGTSQPVVNGAIVTPGTGSVSAAVQISGAGGLASEPAVAFDGTNFLVVWSDVRAGSGEIYARLVDAHGAVLGAEFAVAPGHTGRAHADVTFDGVNFVIVWQEPMTAGTSAFTLMGARVSPAGTLVDTMAFPLTAWAGDSEAFPSLDSDRAGRSMVVYELLGTTPRVMALLITELPPGASCTDNVQCASGQCMNGHCCADPNCGATDAGSDGGAVEAGGVDVIVDPFPDTGTGGGDTATSDGGSPGPAGVGFRGGACACDLAGHTAGGAGHALIALGVAWAFASMRRGRRRA
jgi:hypothetical protein